MAAVDFFLKLDGMEGESHDAKHKGEIDIFSFSWGVSVPVRKAGGGPDNSVFEDLVIVKHVDRTSPQLMLACASGKHIKFATFMVVPTDENGAPRGNTMMLKIEDVVVESVRQMGHEHGGEFPTEEVTLEFGRLDSFTVGDGSV